MSCRSRSTAVVFSSVMACWVRAHDEFDFPGTCRAHPDYIREQMPPGRHKMTAETIPPMGCVVNGPGERRRRTSASVFRAWVKRPTAPSMSTASIIHAARHLRRTGRRIQDSWRLPPPLREEIQSARYDQPCATRCIASGFGFLAAAARGHASIRRTRQSRHPFRPAAESRSASGASTGHRRSSTGPVRHAGCCARRRRRSR